MIIGIVGSIASGKDTVADYLKTKNFKAISLSDILRKIMREEGQEMTTANMTEFGNNLRNEKGHGFLAEKAVKEIKSGDDVVITSIRQVGEIEFLRNQSEFTLIRLDAPTEIRLKRLIERNREGDIKNMAELQEIEAKQADGTGGGMNMTKCFTMADKEIINDGTFEDLNTKIDKLISEAR
ncbi:MAG TPA: dephospho-CoA kinase [Patescibacteria group bacterium]|nr:dephospho-CoA kinase [Patescibacteria group bacterium]